MLRKLRINRRPLSGKSFAVSSCRFIQSFLDSALKQDIDGFGDHDPGKGRHSGKMPLWDCLHPGRAWAERLQPCAFTAEELDQRVREYLSEALL